MSIFTAGRDALSSVFELNAETATYSSGTTSVALLCKVGKTVFRVEDLAAAVSVHVNAVDFIVRWEDLGITPKLGDSISYNGHAYSVYAPSGEPCYRAHTTDASQIRVHALLDEVTNG